MKHPVPQEVIADKILLIRGKKVMLDSDLAKLYEVTTGNLNKAVKRNIARFPDDFMFQLTKDEYDSLRFQIGSLKKGQHSKYLPYVFTEQGVAMLSTVLHSERAIHVNIAIMRVFVRLREILATNVGLARRLASLEQRMTQKDEEIRSVFEAIKQLMAPKDKSAKMIKGFSRE